MSRFVASLFLVSCASASPPAPVPTRAPAPTPSETVAEPVAQPITEPVTEPASPPPPVSAPPLSVDPGCKRDAIVLVLDRSGSMMGAPMEFAKEAAKRVVAKIGKDDCFGLVVFDSKASRAIKLVASLDPKAARQTIDMLTAEGGTEIFSALDIAHADLRAAKSAKRRIALLLTDGQAPHHGIRDLVEAMAVDDIKVSTIGLGSGVDETLLRMIADKGRGHLRKVTAPADLPKNFEEELAVLRR